MEYIVSRIGLLELMELSMTSKEQNKEEWEREKLEKTKQRNLLIAECQSQEKKMYIQQKKKKITNKMIY